MFFVGDGKSENFIKEDGSSVTGWILGKAVSSKLKCSDESAKIKEKAERCDKAGTLVESEK